MDPENRDFQIYYPESSSARNFRADEPVLLFGAAAATARSLRNFIEFYLKRGHPVVFVKGLSVAENFLPGLLERRIANFAVAFNDAILRQFPGRHFIVHVLSEGGFATFNSLFLAARSFPASIPIRCIILECAPLQRTAQTVPRGLLSVLTSSKVAKRLGLRPRAYFPLVSEIMYYTFAIFYTRTPWFKRWEKITEESIAAYPTHVPHLCLISKFDALDPQRAATRFAKQVLKEGNVVLKVFDSAHLRSLHDYPEEYKTAIDGFLGPDRHKLRSHL